jgi:hypothetical protein
MWDKNNSDGKGAIFSFSLSGANIATIVISPTAIQDLYVSKGGLESIHFINEDYETHSKHNFNIDECHISRWHLLYAAL